MTRFVYGIDTASKQDFFAIVVHELPKPEPGISTMPFIRTLRNLTRMSYDKMLTILTKELFNKFPPARIVIDYANEKTIADLLIRRYGETRVEAVNTNVLPNKQMLKDDGLAIVQQGYKFPNWTKIENKDIAKLVNMLMQQLAQEEIVITPSGKTSFNHPKGEHNDLAIAWELSIHGCFKFILNESPPVQVATKKFSKKTDEINMSAYAGNPTIQILGREVHMPTSG